MGGERHGAYAQVSTIEFAQLEQSIVYGLEQGNEVLKQIHKETSIERVEELMQNTSEAQQYQRVRRHSAAGTLLTRHRRWTSGWHTSSARPNRRPSTRSSQHSPPSSSLRRQGKPRRRFLRCPRCLVEPLWHTSHPSTRLSACHPQRMQHTTKCP